MSVEISKLKSRVSGLSHSLDELESILEPLFSQTLPETVVSLEPLQQAKLQTDVPYVIYDLVFRKNEVDKEAAGRFIKHAISSVQWKKTAAEEAQEEPEASTSSSARVPVKITSKMTERAEYEKQLKEKAAAGESEEEDLQVFDEDGEDSMDVDRTAPSSEPATAQNQRKRQRAVVDPFAGYGEEGSEDALKANQGSHDYTPAEAASSTPQPRKKKAKQSIEGTTDSSTKKKKKGKKKADS
ncbi:hypothetical protein MD484_g2053, partial [Candolleomyces efflorescens]